MHHDVKSSREVNTYPWLYERGTSRRPRANDTLLSVRTQKVPESSTAQPDLNSHDLFFFRFDDIVNFRFIPFDKFGEFLLRIGT
jgi:hypothetical protein